MFASNTALSSRIRSYRVDKTAPTDELMTLGQIFAQVGDYASSILDAEHLSTARLCAGKLKKVITALESKGTTLTEDDFYIIPEETINAEDLTQMTVDQLYNLYRQWPLRHQQAPQDNHFTYEGEILNELLTRHPATRSEQLKIDYCTLTHPTENGNQVFPD